MAIADYLAASEGVPDPGASFLKAYQGAVQQRQMQARQQSLQQDIADLQSGPTPEKFANFYLAYPEMKGQIDAYRSTLQDADKNTMLGAAREALAFANAGDTEKAAEALTRRAAAAKDGARHDLAKQFDDAAQFYRMSPQAGSFALRMMYNTLDPEGYKTFYGASENKIAAAIDDLTPFVGAETAKRMVLAQQAAKGVVTTTGPAGATYQRADEVFLLPGGEQPVAAASVATGSPQSAGQTAMTVDQFFAAADALGLGKAVGMVSRNGIPISVKTPAEARRLPSGTKIVLPDGTPGVVP